MQSEPRLLVIREVAAMLRVSERTIRRLEQRGKFPAAIRIGSSMRWREADIKNWIERGLK